MSQKKTGITHDKYSFSYEYITSDIRRKLQGLPEGRRYIRSHWPIVAIRKAQGHSKKLRTLEINLFGINVTFQFALDIVSIAREIGEME